MLLSKCLNYSAGLGMRYSPGRAFLKVIPADQLSVTLVQDASIPDGAGCPFALACLGCQGAGEVGGSQDTGKSPIPNMAFAASQEAPPHLSLKTSF